MNPPTASQCINRGDGVVVHLRSPFGDAFDVEVNENVKLTQLRQELSERLGVPAVLTFMQHDAVLAEDSAIDVDAPVDFTYHLSGGGAGLETVTTLPEAMRVHVLCWKCGCQQVGNLADSVWCSNKTCCLFAQFSTKEVLPEQQLCCLKVQLAPKPVGGCALDTKMPGCLKAKCLWVSCGLGDMPDLATEDWVKSSMLCLFEDWGPEKCFSDIQLLCLKCNF